MMDVVVPHDGVGMVLHPHSRQRIAADLIVLIDPLVTNTTLFSHM